LSRRQWKTAFTSVEQIKSNTASAEKIRHFHQVDLQFAIAREQILIVGGG